MGAWEWADVQAAGPQGGPSAVVWGPRCGRSPAALPRPSCPPPTRTQAVALGFRVEAKTLNPCPAEGPSLRAASAAAGRPIHPKGWIQEEKQEMKLPPLTPASPR
jgi:hypothetical protein